ncbi:MAG: hypothetical protein JOZ63_14910 [Planctomycetaceae bacterium]|nr:hypothetical protein [Planctomycetaceae bacterium]
MDVEDFVQLSLLAMGAEIQGKTKLQKTVYFLGLMTGCVEDLGYRAHFYGPYSDEVADAVGWLRTIGAVDQTSSGVGTVDDSGFEIRRYDFRLNEQGRRFAEATSRRYPDLWQKLREAAGLLKRSGDLDYVKLSIAAKTYFMLQETEGQASEKDLAALATRFGWEVTPQQVRDAASYLERLGLAQIIAD